MKTLNIIIVLLLSCFALSACTRLFGKDAPIRNYEKDYQYSKSIPPLKNPQGTDFANIQSAYPVPFDRPKFSAQPSIIPPGNPGAA